MSDTRPNPCAHGFGQVSDAPSDTGIAATTPDVREFQVRQRGRRLELRIVSADGVAVAGIAGRLSGQVTAALRGLGVADPQVGVVGSTELPRSAGGKLQLVVADVSPGPDPGDRSG